MPGARGLSLEAFATFRSGIVTGNGHKRHKKSRTMRNDQGMRDLCDRIRQTAFDLHGYLRNGNLEKVYENGMAHRLRKFGLSVE